MGTIALFPVAFVFRSSPPTFTSPSAAVADAPIVEVISDQELIEMIADKPVLIRKEGGRIVGVIFMDEKTAPRPW